MSTLTYMYALDITAVTPCSYSIFVTLRCEKQILYYINSYPLVTYGDTTTMYKQCTNIHVGLPTLHTVFLLHMLDDSNQIG